MKATENFNDMKALPLADRQAIASLILRQPLVWSGGKAQCVCPGKALHTKPNADTDCFVYVEPGAPNVDCFHSACVGTRAALTHDLQSIIGKARISFNRSMVGQGAGGPAIHTQSKAIVGAFDPAKLEAIARKLTGADEEWFATRSKMRVDTQTPARFLHELYLPGEKVVIFDEFKSQGQAVWEHCGTLFNARELDGFATGKRVGVWYLNQPVSGEFADTSTLNKDGTPHLSRRSHRTVTSWRYLVLESDEANPAHWLAMLAQQPIPIAAIYGSGGKSIHALVAVNAASKAECDEWVASFKRRFGPLGVDTKTLSSVRLTRLPCCERLGSDKSHATTGKTYYHRFPAPQMQQLIYLNGQPDGTPICEQPIINSGWADSLPAEQDGNVS